MVEKILNICSELFKNTDRRTILFTGVSIGVDIIFAVFNGYTGIKSQSAWFGTMCAYYIALTAARGLIVFYFFHGGKGGNDSDHKIYLAIGIIIGVINIILAGAVAVLATEYEGRKYPGNLIYVVAVFVFYKMVVSIIDMIHAKKMDQPAIISVRAITHIEALTATLCLQASLFISFGDPASLFCRCFNAITGSAVWFISLGFSIALTGKYFRRKKG